jgi:hypothetical protein
LGGDPVLDRVLASARMPIGTVALPTPVLVIPGSESLPDAAALDDLLRMPFQHIVVTTPLTADASDGAIERIDGPRWVVIHAAADAGEAPGTTSPARRREDDAVARGAIVVRTTGCFGRNLDNTVSPLIRMVARLPVCPIPMSASNPIQPLHVDDLLDLFDAVRSRPRSGRFEAGGSEAITASELLDTIATIVGTRRLYLRAGGESLHRMIGTLLGIRRFAASDTADVTDVSETFGWSPEPLGVRLEQAVREVAS